MHPTSPLGTLHAAGDGGVVRIETLVAAPAPDVWAALTTPVRLADWLGEVSGELGAGGAFRAHFRVSGWDGTGRVEVCEPGRRLVVATREDGDAVDGTTEVSLGADGERTRVVVLQRGLPLEQLAAYGAGLQLHVEDLVAHLAGRGDRTTLDRWNALHPAWQALTVTPASPG
jgi:uncharacterized protein YndB with AHSA1/START domain